MEVATVFLETSLGTRLAVSFPASATTVADLKRRVSDEHAAAFPHIGHIAVQAIKVNQGGSLYQLTNSMAVRDAFRGVTGAWHLQVDALPCSAPHVAHQQMMPQVPHACNCKHPSEPSVPTCHQHDSSSRRSFAAALECRKRSVCEMLTHQQAQLEATHTETERPPREKHRAVKRPAAASDFDFGLLSVSVHKEPCSSIAGDMCNAANSKEDTHLAPCVEELNQGDPCSQMQVEEKETWTPKQADSSLEEEAMQNNVEENVPLTAKVCNGERNSNGTDHPPPPCAVVSTKEGHSLENEAMQCSKVDENEPLTAKAVCNDQTNDNRTDLPPPCAAESTKEGDSSEKQATTRQVEEKKPLTTKVCSGDGSSQGTNHPPPCAAESTKEGDSSEKEAMQHKTEEKEPLTAKVCDGERSSNGTDLQPPCAADSTKEGDLSEKEAMTCREEKEPLAANVCNGDESSNKETDHPSPCAAESTKEGDSYEKEEAIKHKAEEKVCNSESSSNWADPSPGHGSMNEADSSENEVMQHEAEEKEPWTDSVCKGGGSSHWNDPIEWTDAEQRAWEMALKKRRRPRTTVRKMPNSRAAKLYGYS